MNIIYRLLYFVRCSGRMRTSDRLRHCRCAHRLLQKCLGIHKNFQRFLKMEHLRDPNYPKHYPYFFREEMNNGFCMNPNGMMTGPGISGLAGSSAGAQPLDSQYRPENRREKSNNKRAKPNSVQQSYEEKYESQRQKTSFKHEEGKIYATIDVGDRFWYSRCRRLYCIFNFLTSKLN